MNAIEAGAATAVAEAYEALRAQATGIATPVTPRGLSLFLRAGLAAWMVAWTSTTAPRGAAMPPGRPRPVLSGLSMDLVSVLAEMVLAGQRRGVV
jgi:hypothetical protein